MSERSKGDVSTSMSRVNNNANRVVVKNPLLSASVTGLSFDDYPNKPLLLPAAPPMVHAPPPQPTNALIAGILKRDQKTLVTVGQRSSIDDSETLDEINLNASGSDDSIAANPTLNPYQNVADANANPLLEPPPAAASSNADSLLSQAASSFGALPSVASNVFSSFSKRIYASNRESEELQPQLDIQPTYIQQAGQAAPATTAPAPFYAAPPAALGEAAPEPPKFYAPTELPNLAAGALPPPSSGQNSYRLAARKKLYAPIPGFSEQQQQQQQQQQAVPNAAPFQTPPYPAQPAVAAFEPPAPPPQELPKSGGGLFSLTSLVPTGVLQNISGLVQSATGRANEPSPPPVDHSAPVGYFDITTTSAADPPQPTNFFAPATVPASAAAAGFFVPTEAPSTVGGFLNPTAVASVPETIPPPAIGAFYTPATAAQPLGAFQPLGFSQPPVALQPPAAFQPPAAAQPPVVFQPPGFSQPPLAFQTSALAESSSAPGPPPASALPPPSAGIAQASYRLQKGTRLYKSPLTAQEIATAATTTTAAFDQQTAPAPAVIFNPFGVATAVSEGVNYFAPPAAPGVLLAPSADSSQESAAPPTSHFTPQAITTAPQAAINSFVGAISEGIALFAPPAAATTTTAHLTPQHISAPQEVATTSPLLFAPGSAPTAEGIQEPFLHPPPTSSTSHFTPQTFTESSTYSAPQLSSEAQEVPLFAAPPTATLPAAGISLFTPTTSEPSSLIDTKQEVPLFAAPPTAALPASGISLFTPNTSEPISLLATKLDTNQEVPLLFAAPTTATGLDLFTPQAATTSLITQTASNTAPKLATSLFSAPSTAEVQPSSVAELTSAVEELALYPTGAATTLFKPEGTQETSKTAATEEVALFAAPTTSSYQEVNSFNPTAPTAPSAELNLGSTLFVPVPTEAIATAALYPPATAALYPPATAAVAAATSIAESTQGITLFEPAKLSPISSTSTQHAQAGAPLTTTSTLFAPPTLVSGSDTNDLFAQPKDSITALPSVALTTQTTTTFFNPFAQTITTPLPQDLLPPPIGFVADNNTQAEILFESQTIEPVLELETALAPPITAPPKQSENSSQANPFRKSSEIVAQSTAAPSHLLSFFTPAASTSDFNFFAAPQQQLADPLPEVEQPPNSNNLNYFAANQQAAGQFPELPPQLNVAPPALATGPPPPPPSTAAGTTPTHSNHSLGFEQLISDSQQIVNSTVLNYQNSSVNSFSGYFGAAAEEQQQESSLPVPQPQPEPQPQTQLLTGSANFFDHFAAATAAQEGQEDQRIQNFFNNPPLQDQPAAPGELKYDIVHSGLPSKQFEERSQTSISNLVEPPSSACSEFSLAAPTAAQAQAVATSAAVPQTERPVDYLLQLHQGELPEEILQQLRMANEKGQSISPPADAIIYTPVLLHWFYKRIVDGKHLWTPFSHYDSALLETSLTSDEADSTSIVAVEGGRYDVNIKERTKTPVFWEGKAIEVRRCSWFYKAVDSKYVPYAEETAAALEIEYRRATETGEWHKKIPLANGEQVTMHGPTVIVHFMPPSNADTWGGSVQSSTRPLVVKRDLNDFKIQPGESQRVDHLLFMVHGIGSACDLKMRNVEEVVDDFRFIAQQLVQSHYKNSTDMGLVGRVEVLPIEWHGHLHSEELGIDEKLKSITLESIPRLRNFTNDTLLDVLFYTSPKYCQKIMNTVADALNEVYLKYRMRHPEFNGGVSLAGHSLGSLILFDLLCHQESFKESEEENKENPDQLPLKQSSISRQVQLPNNDEMMPKQVSYAMGVGPGGTGQPVINYTQLIFNPKKFFALGSPIGMFVTIRGIDKLGLDFRLPTCPGFYNIFHPFDPVAYRIEALVNPDMKGIRPVLIPHHKGRKRMHLELKETMTRVGADIKQRFMDTFKTTLDSVNFLATVTKVKKEAEQSLEKVASSSHVFQKQNEDQDESSVATTSTHARHRTDSESTTTSDPEFIELDFPLGKLNDSKRVDYVLQEAPLEFINEYIFALSSHVCYWGSEDTILFVMKEIYAGLGISTDSQVPQQSMTIERPSSRSNSVSQSMLPM